MDVRLPDGTIIQNVPDDISKADLIGKLANNGHDVSELIKQTAAEQTAADTGVMGSVLPATGRMLDKLGSGVKQLYYGMTGDKRGQEELAGQEADAQRTMGVLDKAHPIATAIGSALPLLATAPLTGGASLGATALRTAASAAVPEALSYGTSDERAKNAAMAAGLGAGGAVAGAALGGAVKVAGRPFGTASADTLAAAARLSAQGVSTTPAQATGSETLKSINAALDKLPFSAGMQKTFSDTQRAQVNKAVASTFGSTAEKLGPTELTAARDALGKQFNGLAARNTVSQAASNQLASDLAGIMNDTARYSVSDTQKITSNIIDDVLDKVGTNGTIEGKAYKSLDSFIGKKAKEASSGEVRNTLGQVRDALRNAMDSSVSPADAAAWKQVRQQYFNLMQAAKAVDPATGNVSVAKLANTMATSGPSAKFSGAGQLGQLSRDVKLTIGNTEPNSGTAGRTFWQHAMTGGAGGLAAVNPALLGALIIPPVAQKGFNSSLATAVAKHGILPGIEAASVPTSEMMRYLGLLTAAQQGK